MIADAVSLDGSWLSNERFEDDSARDLPRSLSKPPVSKTGPTSTFEVPFLFPQGLFSRPQTPPLAATIETLEDIAEVPSSHPSEPELQMEQESGGLSANGPGQGHIASSSHASGVTPEIVEVDPPTLCEAQAGESSIPRTSSRPQKRKKSQMYVLIEHPPEYLQQFKRQRKEMTKERDLSEYTWHTILTRIH